MVNSDAVDAAINKGLDYLAQHQYPSGEFCSYIAPDDAMQQWCATDSTVFFTSVIGTCLLPLSKSSAAGPILLKITDYLQYQMAPGGVWNFFAMYHPMRWVLPYDADSLSFASSFMQARGVQFPEQSNKQLLLANRARGGLFYTWFALHRKIHTNKTLWRLSLRALCKPFRTLLFLARNGEDVNLGVNASILAYLGNIPETDTIVNALIKMIDEGKEDNCDKWYLNPFTIYYLISRAYNRGVMKLQPVSAPIIERILATMSAEGQLGKSVFDTAIGVTALINFGMDPQDLHKPINFLINKQEPHGEWPRWLFFYINPQRHHGWGSEELTTALCVEALAKYKSSLAIAPSKTQ